jgi:hypothetical protein
LGALRDLFSTKFMRRFSPGVVEYSVGVSKDYIELNVSSPCRDSQSIRFRVCSRLLGHAVYLKALAWTRFVWSWSSS